MSSAYAVRLFAAACSPRRARSRVAPLAAAALPVGLKEGALMLADAVSSARTAGGGGAHDELVCFVHSDSPPPIEHPDASSFSSYPFYFIHNPIILHSEARGHDR